MLYPLSYGGRGNAPIRGTALDPAPHYAPGTLVPGPARQNPNGTTHCPRPDSPVPTDRSRQAMAPTDISGSRLVAATSSPSSHVPGASDDGALQRSTARRPTARRREWRSAPVFTRTLVHRDTAEERE